MNAIAVKRIMKDLEVLKKNQDALAKDGMFFHVDQSNLYNLKLLIIPRHKADPSDPSLVSPYIGGFFVFEFTFPVDFPLNPPKIMFHPQQNSFRLHPNYYTSGKVCLSVINTWAGQDWSPATSIMSLFQVLEERFNERPLCFEPGQENALVDTLKQYNAIVHYGTFKVSILPVLESKLPVFADFKDVIKKHFLDNFDVYIKSIDAAAAQNPSPNRAIISPLYGYTVTPDYQKLKEKLTKLYESL